MSRRKRVHPYLVVSSRGVHAYLGAYITKRIRARLQIF